MSAVALGPLARAVLALAIAHAPPGRSPYSYEPLPACGTDPEHATCNVKPVCADPSVFCRAPRWNAARHSWVRVESREAAMQRYVRIAKALSDTAKRLASCRAPDGAPLATCQPIGWSGSERTLALSALAVALHESGLREDIEHGYPPLGRGPAGEVCLLQVALDQGPRQAMWLPEEEREPDPRQRCGARALCQDAARRLAAGAGSLLRGRHAHAERGAARLLARRRAVGRGHVLDVRQWRDLSRRRRQVAEARPSRACESVPRGFPPTRLRCWRAGRRLCRRRQRTS